MKEKTNKRRKKSVNDKQEKQTEPNEPIEERSFTAQAIGKINDNANRKEGVQFLPSLKSWVPLHTIL